MNQEQLPPNLQSLFDELTPFKQPPVDTWNPEKTVQFDMRIDLKGDWFHEGTQRKRQPLVKLFASLLRREGADYFLITPREKFTVQVEDVPFIIMEMALEQKAELSHICFRTNMDEVVCLSDEHPLKMFQPDWSKTPCPYVLVRDRLWARISRPCFYQLAESAVPDIHNPDSFGVFSGRRFFPM